MRFNEAKKIMAVLLAAQRKTRYVDMHLGVYKWNYSNFA